MQKIKNLMAMFMVLLTMVGLAACDSTEVPDSIKLDTPVITVIGDTLSWTTVSYATSYDISMNGEVINTKETTYNLSSLETGTYEISVVALSTVSEYLTSDASNLVTYYANEQVPLEQTLIAPVISVSSHVLTWPVVNHATGYDIYVDGIFLESITTNTYTYHNEVAGTYSLTVIATSTDILFLDSVASSAVSVVVNEPIVDPVSLATPAVSINSDVLSWSAIEHATEYIIYLNGEEFVKVNETSYDLTQIVKANNYQITIKAVSNDAAYKMSDTSNSVGYKVEVKPVDLSSPLVMYIKGSDKMPTFNASQLMVKGSEFDQVTDYTSYAFQFIKLENENYLIKLQNGMYLTYAKDNTGTDRFQAYYKNNSASQEFVINEFAANEYKIAPALNASYPMCEEGGGDGYHQYADLSDPSQIWVVFNVNVTINEDAVNDQPLVDKLVDPVVMYVQGSNLMPTFNENGLMIKGEDYNNVSDYTNYTFKFVKLDNGNYLIKLQNGLYLTYKKDDTNADRFYADYKNDLINQEFSVTAVLQDQYKIIPMGNPGYLMCEEGDGVGYHQYADISAASQIWIVFNVDVVIQDDQIDENVVNPLDNPLVMYVKSSSVMPTFDENGLMVQGVTYDSIDDYSNYAFKFIKLENGNYLIKLQNGLYLTYKKDNTGADRFYADYKDSSINQEFIVKQVAEGEYKVEPAANPGYLICEEGTTGYHQYSDANAASQIWIVFNVEVMIQDDQVKEEVVVDPLDGPLVMYVQGSSVMPIFDENGLMIQGVTYDSVSDYTNYTFQFIKLDNENYLIKLQNGMYLTYKKDDTNADRFYADYKDGLVDQEFIVKLYAENQYKLEPAANAGYVICEEGSTGYHQYSDISHPTQIWAVFNVEVTIQDDQIKEDIPTDPLDSPLVMYVQGSSVMPIFDENGLMVQGVAYDSIADYTNHTFQFIKLDNGNYLIKLQNGLYLTYAKDNTGADRFYARVKDGLLNQEFIVKLYAENQYKLEPAANAGYVICEEGSTGYHQYSDISHPTQIWVVFNVDVIIAQDQVA